ncbi:UDP-N-acetyl-D-galactosamine dehydrogenase [Thioalkalivibrio denitrificans]|uniref:UDP-N-acetyl-D-galactosamine dehydrogenase n=1 Tax=Thioalkalivibrio denitrificans TaxID=108003 RepID=A0A1V3NGA9_9GAMM|nr:nucleotide sugar dehydrogenase [Thioalkalivibrio denitrificans]OOG23882.1 UDP-N-acetyl-D-galactosamine dehydrogenase [Thioalkalivibrio denitrificans]
MSEKVGVIGLGYVGLPVALGFARHYPDTVGFDISERRVTTLRGGHDFTGEVTPEELEAVSIRYTTDPADLEGVTFFVVTVPTPIDDNRQPDLRPVISACETVGRVLSRGAVVVFESTVYPGVTEEVCGPILARLSGLEQGKDFKLGYSPERINPGDREHTLERIVKVVSGEDAETLDRVAGAYEKIVTAGIHRAPTIRVAEAAKVIENTQRDLNIALMNELALIFDRLGIRTKDVLAAAGTKWNFLPFSPGLVGGHCIGVDPYYLTTKAKSVGYYPQVILAGRRINDGMGAYIAQKLVKMLIEQDRPVKQGRVGVLGLTFKENVPDLRNSRVPDIVKELRQFGIEPLIHDALADADEARHEYELELTSLDASHDLDGLILAVPHRVYVERGPGGLCDMLVDGGVFVDVKSAMQPEDLPPGHTYWSL